MVARTSGSKNAECSEPDSVRRVGGGLFRQVAEDAAQIRPESSLLDEVERVVCGTGSARIAGSIGAGNVKDERASASASGAEPGSVGKVRVSARAEQAERLP